jgi:hypothetical protein
VHRRFRLWPGTIGEVDVPPRPCINCGRVVPSAVADHGAPPRWPAPSGRASGLRNRNRERRRAAVQHEIDAEAERKGARQRSTLDEMFTGVTEYHPIRDREES